MAFEKIQCLFKGHDVDYYKTTSYGKPDGHCNRCLDIVDSRLKFSHKDFLVFNKKTNQSIRFGVVESGVEDFDLEIAFDFNPYLAFQKICEIMNRTGHNLETLFGLDKDFEMPDPEEVDFRKEDNLYHMYVKAPLFYKGGITAKDTTKKSPDEIGPVFCADSGSNFAILGVGYSPILNGFASLFDLELEGIDSSREKGGSDCTTMCWGKFRVMPEYSKGKSISIYRMADIWFLPNDSSSFLGVHVFSSMKPEFLNFMIAIKDELTEEEKKELGFGD